MLLFMLGYVWVVFVFFFFKQKTAYEMRISDWSSDVCSSDLRVRARKGSHDRLDPRDPRPCRPPLGRASPEGVARRPGRHRRAHHRGAEDIQGDRKSVV